MRIKSFRSRNLNKMGNLVDLALGLLVIRLNFLIADFEKTESICGSYLILFSTDGAFTSFTLRPAAFFVAIMLLLLNQ